MAAFPNYTAYVATIAEMAAIQNAQDPNLVAILPAVIDYAEQRIYRELDLISTTVTDTSLSLTAGARSLAYTANTAFVTLQSASLLIQNARTELQPVSRELLDAVYGNPSTAAPPQWFAILDGKTMLVGPFPDQAYQMELTGTARPQPLSNANGTTFLTQNLPDLFLAASMIFVAGYQKNFGAQSDSPQAAMSWEQQYQTLKASAVTEEARKKFASAGWSAYSAPVAATPTR